MYKKIINLGCLITIGYFYSQDVSVIRNTTDVYDHSYITGTARFSGMGGAMGALGGDVSTMNTNPAGLGVAITGSINGTLNSVGNSNSSTLKGTQLSYKTNATNLGQIGGIIAIEMPKNSDWRFVNLGINYSQVNIENYVQTPSNHDIYDSVIVDNPDGTSSNINLLFNGHAYDRTGNISNLNLGVGANYNNKIYIGGSVNLHSASILKQSDFFAYKKSNDGLIGYYNKNYTPYSEASNGISANVGIIGKITENLRLGLAIETPTSWNSERSYNQYGQDNNADTVSDVYNEVRRFSTPSKVTASAAFVPNKNLSLNVDYRISLGTPNFKSDGLQSATEQLRDFYNQNTYTNNELRTGLEYRIKQFRLRGGYALLNQKLKDETLSVIQNATTSSLQLMDHLYFSKQQTLSAGLGYDFKTFFIDIAYQSMNTTYSNPFFAGTYGSGDFNEIVNNSKSIVSQVNQKRNTLLVGVGWKF